MIRFSLLVSFALLLSACDARTPTEPLALETQQPATLAPVTDETYFGCTSAGAYANPGVVAVRPGEVADVKVRLCYGPANLPWDIIAGPPDVIEGRARIEPGQSETTLRIRGVGEGVGGITYVVSNFGRAPAVRTIGNVYVANPRRRAVR
ncbi:MAG TPA: hypothetical protein VF787_07625 [Thermoanaerobaculia bacterium]